jgi:VWFA-related protein
MRRASLFVCIVLGAVTVTASRQSPASQQPSFRAGVEITQLDVSVLDKDRHPIRDLTQADFTVLEDGKPRPIVAFSAVDVAEVSPSSTAEHAASRKTWTRDVTPDVTTNALPPEGPLFAMVLDDALLPADPKILEDAKKAARSVVDHLSPGDQMAIVFTANGRNAQDFTSDRTKLMAAVEKLQVGHATYTLGWETAVAPQAAFGRVPASPGVPPVFDGDNLFRQGSLNTLRDVADVLAAAPQRRKVLVYVSPGIPIDYEDTSPTLAHGTAGKGGELHGKSMAVLDENRHLAEQLSDIFRMMQRANVTVYPIDPSGLDGLEQFVRRVLQGQPALMAALTQNSPHPTTDTPNNPRELAHHLVMNALDFVETAAANTGGRAIVNTNDFEPGIEAIFRENGSYYLLGIDEKDPGNGDMHRLSVKVDRPGVEVRTRSGYYASDAKAAATLEKASPVTRAIAAALPGGALSMHVMLAPFASLSAVGGTVAIALELSQPAPKERSAGTIDVEAKAFTPDGYARGDHAQTVHLSLLPGGSDDALARYQVLSQMDLKPGRYQLRIGAHTSIGDLTGSVFADVEVPDFAAVPVSLSGVLIEASPTTPAVPKDALASLVPVVPTAERTFDRRDHASAFVRVYQGGATPLVPATLTITILNDKSETMLKREDAIGAASFNTKTRAADDRITLPLDTLAPGDYLLTIETTRDKTSARRDVRFSVR